MKLRALKGRSRLYFLIGFGIVGLFAYFYLFNLAPSDWTKMALDPKNPAMWKRPVALPDLAISNASGRKLSYFGWEFEVPWGDLDPAKSELIGRPPRQWQLIYFRSGRAIIFIRHPADHWSKILYPSNATYLDKMYFRWLFGADASSDYAFTRAMLETTPDQLTSFTFGTTRGRLTLLLGFKSIALADGDAKSGIFIIHTPHFEGFQYGNPESGQREIDDVLYSKKAEIEFRFWSGPRSKAWISQADINRVIQTLKLLNPGARHTTG